jgi:hypothetical protein
MIINGLNDFSQRFADHLFVCFPEMAKYARADEGALVVEVPSPANSKRGLIVASDDNEISLGFDNWHAHVGDETTSETQKFELASQLVDDFLHERVMVAAKFKDQQFVAAKLLRSEEGLDSEPPAEAGERLFVRSFRGTHDANYQANETIEH